MTLIYRKGRYVAKEKGKFPSIGPTRAHARMGIFQQEYRTAQQVAMAIMERWGK